MLNSQISNEGVEDDERTISVVEDVISMSQISQQSFQPLPVEEEALTTDNDLQAPQDSSGIANVATPNKEPSRKVTHNRETVLLALENSLAKITNIGYEIKEFPVIHESSQYIVSEKKNWSWLGAHAQWRLMVGIWRYFLNVQIPAQISGCPPRCSEKESVYLSK